MSIVPNGPHPTSAQWRRRPHQGRRDKSLKAKLAGRPGARRHGEIEANRREEGAAEAVAVAPSSARPHPRGADGDGAPVASTPTHAANKNKKKIPLQNKNPPNEILSAAHERQRTLTVDLGWLLAFLRLIN